MSEFRIFALFRIAELRFVGICTYFHKTAGEDSTYVLFLFLWGVGYKTASWRMPTPEQMEKLAPDVEKDAAKGVVGASDPISEAYWAAVLQDTRAEPQVVPIQNCRLSDIARHVLRVSCRRCDRVVEIQRSDAVRLYGGHTVWKDVGRHSAHVEPYLIIVGAKMAPKYHPTPLSGGDRKALKKELGKSRAMTGILSAQADELRSRGEALLQKSDNLACQSWNERMWSDGEPIDPSPTIN